MNDELISELARALAVPIPPERLAGVAESLAAQIAGGGGLSPDELDGIEPAVVFDPGGGVEP
jgi:hypothetical protein